MPRQDHWETEWDDEYEPEGDEEYVEANDEDEPTIPCPYCQRQMHADSPRCPYCENYLSREDIPPTRKPWWIILGVVAGLYVVYRWIRGG